MAFFRRRRASRSPAKKSAERESGGAGLQEDDPEASRSASTAEGTADLRADTEVWFTRQGLPHLIDDYSATQDIFTRMTPFLIIAFFAEVGFGFGNRFSGWAQAEIIGLFLLASIGSGAVLNLVRKRHVFALPKRVGALEIGVFVLVPALLSMIPATKIMFKTATTAKL